MNKKNQDLLLFAVCISCSDLNLKHVDSAGQPTAFVFPASPTYAGTSLCVPCVIYIKIACHNSDVV